MLCHNFIQKLMNMITRKKEVRKTSTTTLPPTEELRRYHRGCFVKLPDEKTKFCETQKSAAMYISNAYGVEVNSHKVSNALSRGGVVYCGKAKIALARVSYKHDIEDK